MSREQVIKFIVLSFVFIIFGLCMLSVYIGAKEQEEALNEHLENCISNPNCIHKVRHLSMDAVVCIQDERCYNYLKERIVKK